MKKFLVYVFLVLAVLATIFTAILYSEGFFDGRVETDKSDIKPFIMKCESGKCAVGKCAGGK
ncbi:MAG: hypothetical protein DRQ78_11520 [Epsilonproteobacteria bacterium]|nr:MAG: hypothetical protein DRQ78_11520 [Campylobacterota bacterium]